ncbi:immune inhibitor A domain-containing protein [Phycicoccus flavus]|uniref:immune inhibitor A domain-containing protein n=1 Tax=Phycicoccus flavus TaxID=2502783 RepID=UPI000FEC1245|nr:immune inhibitor A domain-containing protein [Phycicoccus flavus]NHA67745.1 M6 family metalloprotease domain-containing protein [Phycicoccus flavus]
MKRHLSTVGGRAVAAAASGLLVAGLVSTGPAQAAAPVQTGLAEQGAEKDTGHVPEHPLPMARKQAALKEAALQKRVEGKKGYQGKTAKVGKGQYVELEREGTDPVFVIIVEFGDEQYPNAIFQGPPPDGSTTDVTGPLHNEIPEPDRSVDNSTLWQADYDKAHYEDMYFNRMAEYYETQSSNRYSVRGAVHGWVKVPFNEALYGRDYCGGIVCATSKALTRDAMAVWVKQRLDAGMTMAEIQDYLSQFDVWDRYDIDGDGDFNEPDGVIDHMQVVHAGGDQAAGDPNQGSDAIWSHRWYANLQGGGPLGSGVNIGANSGIVSSSKIPNNPTGIWLGDYTVQPENGGLGVFAHEYGHDLGLPDLYDTSGNTGGAENSTAFWTLMSSGANIGDGGDDGIGDAPTDLSAWELLQLGWLSPQGDKGPFYETAYAGQKSTHKLGPNVPATKSPQAVFVVLPDKEVPQEIGTPYEGETFFYSGSGNDLNTTMTHGGITGTALSAQVRYEIEAEWDYAFLEASSDGTNFSPVMTNLSDSATHSGHNQSGFNNSGAGITGSQPEWTELTATLPAGTTSIRFRYQTDGAVAESGFQVDAITVGGTALDDGWTFDGFSETTGTEVQKFFNAYVLENRQYDGYDASLRTAYNFGFADSRPDWVETYPYQNGLLVWYWNDEFTDNNVGDHPGEGLLLPVDAHPTFHHYADGQLMRQRLLSYDSTFGTERTDAITIHKDSQPASIPSQPAVRTFDDTKTWWYDCDADACTGDHVGRYQPGWTGVDVPKTGTTVTVNGGSSGSHLNITVAPKK